MSTPEPIALGLVGIGKIARDQHLPALERVPRFTLAAMASHDPGGDPAIRYRTVEELIAGEPDVTAISLATPPVGRAAIARSAIEAGRHVMLEKPPCATLGEVRALTRLADEKGVVLYASWHSREAAGVAKAREWLAGKTIRSGRIIWREDVRVWHPGQDWIFAAGGMGVFDPAINAFSILTEIVPADIAVRSATLDFPANRDGPIRAAVEFAVASGATIKAELDFLYPGEPEWTIELVTDSGCLRLTHGGANLTIDGVDATRTSDGEYVRLYRNFADAIAAGRSDVDPRPLELVADSMMVAARRTVAPFDFDQG